MLEFEFVNHDMFCSQRAYFLFDSGWLACQRSRQPHQLPPLSNLIQNREFYFINIIQPFPHLLTPLIATQAEQSRVTLIFISLILSRILDVTISYSVSKTKCIHSIFLKCLKPGRYLKKKFKDFFLSKLVIYSVICKCMLKMCCVVFYYSII